MNTKSPKVIIENKKPKIKKEKKKIKREVAKVLNKNSMVKKNLLAMNPYLMTLLDPFNVNNARIPDLVMYPSIPISAVHRSTLTVNANGVCGAIYGLAPSSGVLPLTCDGSLIPCYVGPGTYGTAQYPIGTSLSSTATVNSLLTGVTRANWYELISFKGAGPHPIPDLFEKLRIVSAGFNIQYTGTALDSKGKITIAVATRNLIRNELALSTASGLSLDRISQLPGSRTIPVNQLTGATGLYKPLDTRSLQYADIGPNIASPTSTVTWSNEFAQYVGCEVFLLVDGATAGASFQVTSVFNYEAIPLSNAFNLSDASPSPSDPIALSHAVNTIQQTPATIASSKEELGISSGAQDLAPPNLLNSNSIGHKIHDPIEQPSMFDKILNGVGSFVDGSMKVVDRVAPLASKIMDIIL